MNFDELWSALEKQRYWYPSKAHQADLDKFERSLIVWQEFEHNLKWNPESNVIRPVPPRPTMKMLQSIRKKHRMLNPHTAKWYRQCPTCKDHFYVSGFKAHLKTHERKD